MEVASASAQKRGTGTDTHTHICLSVCVIAADGKWGKGREEGRNTIFN